MSRRGADAVLITLHMLRLLYIRAPMRAQRAARDTRALRDKRVRLRSAVTVATRSREDMALRKR